MHQQNCADAPSLVNVRVPIASQARVEPPRDPAAPSPTSPLLRAPPSTCNVIAGNIRIGAPLLRETRETRGRYPLSRAIGSCDPATATSAGKFARARARGVAGNYFTNPSRDAAVSTRPPWVTVPRKRLTKSSFIFTRRYWPTRRRPRTKTIASSSRVHLSLSLSLSLSGFLLHLFLNQ